MGCSPGLFVLLPFAILAPLGAAWAQNSAMGTSAPGYEVARSQSVQDAPPGSVGRKTTDREHRVGKTDETRGQEVTYVFTIGGFAHRCPNADGIVDGEFEYTLTYDAVTMVDGEPQRTYKARRLYARLKGQVGDDAKLDHVDLDGTYTTEDNDAGVAPRSTGHAVHTTFRLTNGEPDWGALRSVVEATGEISVAAAVLLVSPVYMAAQNEWGKLNECVELSFDPPSDTRSLGPNESAQVRVGLQTKQGKTPVPWKSDSINAWMGIGSVAPQHASARADAPATLTYTASSQPRAGHGIDIGAAVSRAGVAEGRWRIKDDILCSVSWEDTTHGGDRFTVQGDAMVSQIAPEANGGFVALGYGQGTVTYHPVNGCRVTNGDTFTAQYVVTVESDDGRSARVDIGSSDQPHTFSVVCPGLLEGRGVSKRPQATADFDPPGLPTVTVELHEGATPFSNDRPVRTVAGLQRVGDEGTVTLRYCTPEQSNGQ